MKHLIKVSASIIASIVVFVAEITINSTCWMKAYQEELPKVHIPQKQSTRSA